jgi:hypothetical protein
LRRKTPDGILAYQSVPILAELHRKLLIWKEQLLPKHPMAEAVNYTLKVSCRYSRAFQHPKIRALIVDHNRQMAPTIASEAQLCLTS